MTLYGLWTPNLFARCDKICSFFLKASLRESFKKEEWKFSNFFTADPSFASSHWLQPDLDAPGCC